MKSGNGVFYRDDLEGRLGIRGNRVNITGQYVSCGRYVWYKIFKANMHR